MTAEEFKKDNPSLAHLEDDPLWDAMTEAKLRQQDGERVLRQGKPWWRRIKSLRWLFYLPRPGWLVDKDYKKMCKNCKRASNNTIIWLDFSREKKSFRTCLGCGKELIEVKNTTLRYKVYSIKKWTKHLFLGILHNIHILKFGERYGLMADEGKSGDITHMNMDTGEVKFMLVKRKWYEKIFIIHGV